MRNIIAFLFAFAAITAAIQSYVYYHSCEDGMNRMNGRCWLAQMSGGVRQESILNNVKENRHDAEIKEEKPACPDGRKEVGGKCWRNIYKCTEWESEHVCRACEAGYHLEWYGTDTRICYANQETADSVCKSKKPGCKYASGGGWAADKNRGIPWVDCGDNADNVWWFIFNGEKWIPNGKKGNPECE